MRCPFGQAALDGVLAREQPVHSGVQVVLIHRCQRQRVGERVARRGGGQAPGGGEFRAGVEEAGDQQGQHALPCGVVLAGDESVQAQVFEGAEHGGDVAVGLGAGDSKGLVRVGDGVAAFEQGAQPLDEGGGPVGEVGEGAFFDFTGVAIGLAQEDSGRGVAIGDGFDVHGY